MKRIIKKLYLHEAKIEQAHTHKNCSFEDESETMVSTAK